MSSNLNESEGSDSRTHPFFVLILLGAACALVFGLFALKKRLNPEAPPPAEASVPTATPAPAETDERHAEMGQAPEPSTPLADAIKPVAPSSRPGPGAATESAAQRPVASAETRQMVESLMRMNPDGAPVSPEQAGAWKQNLQALIQQGAGGIPAIRDFLELNKDFVFGSANAEALGYPSVRGALFDALRQIGGPEGAQGLLGALQGTGDPREVLTLARTLESMAAGEHRQEMLDSARQVLAMAGGGELKGYDVGPLFEVLQKYGGAEALPDLEQATAKWKYYGAIGLANLPEGAGIPTLIQMATGTSGNRPLALEMLAQVSLQYPEARTALLDQVRAGKIPPYQWPYLGSVLGGDYYQLPDALWFASQTGVAIDRQKTAHIQFGNQNFYQGTPPGGGLPDQLAQQIALADEIAAATSDPAAKKAVETAKGALNRRLSSLTAAAAAPNQ